MRPQTFVKSKHPDAKLMYRESAGFAVMCWDKEKQETIILSYGNTPANAWKNAKENILKPTIQNHDNRGNR